MGCSNRSVARPASERQAVGLFHQLLTGRFLQRIDELLLVLEQADGALLFSVHSGRTLEPRGIHARLQFFKQVDYVLCGICLG